MRIVIDAGHGGTDPGAQYNGWVEKNINLTYAKLFNWRFQSECGEMHGSDMTREDDRTVSLNERVEIANGGWDPHAFLSFHTNSNEGVPGRGFEIFHYPGSVRGKALATEICNAWPFEYNRGVKSADFHVLRETKCPAVLIELGFINNTWDMDLLSNTEDAMRAVESIEVALWDWRLNDRRGREI